MQQLIVSTLLALTIGTVTPSCDACAMQLNAYAHAGSVNAVYYCSDCAADGIGHGSFCLECFSNVHNFE